MLELMSANFWPNYFGKTQAIIYKLSPSPQNYMLLYESSLCSSPNTPINPTPHNNIHCPQKRTVTVNRLGRLGNQMYEYISVWAMAKTTGREPYIPSCMIQELGKIF
jgi:galactoside 2-L-fucosyltransferase 1/2